MGFQLLPKWLCDKLLLQKLKIFTITDYIQQFFYLLFIYAKVGRIASIKMNKILRLHLKFACVNNKLY